MNRVDGRFKTCKCAVHCYLDVGFTCAWPRYRQCHSFFWSSSDYSSSASLATWEWASVDWEISTEIEFNQIIVSLRRFQLSSAAFLRSSVSNFFISNSRFEKQHAARTQSNISINNNNLLSANDSSERKASASRQWNESICKQNGLIWIRFPFNLHETRRTRVVVVDCHSHAVLAPCALSRCPQKWPQKLILNLI